MGRFIMACLFYLKLAFACGGLFNAQTPVNQAAERILSPKLMMVSKCVRITYEAAHGIWLAFACPSGCRLWLSTDQLFNQLDEAWTRWPGTE